MRAWIPVSVLVAPVALVGGWTVAQSRQPSSYDALRDTISALAARDAADAWVMTAGLVVLGLAHLATAAGLVEVGVPARLVLGLGGVATVAVAALPQPNAGHLPAATVGFVALALWPALVTGRGGRMGRAASVLLLVLMAWLVVEVGGDGPLLGLSERVGAGAESLGPLLVAWTLRRPGRA